MLQQVPVIYNTISKYTHYAAEVAVSILQMNEKMPYINTDVAQKSNAISLCFLINT